ncbi:MAG: hypothetical protein SPD90_07045 [Intestinibacter sp.]|uniref:hypothetical protein n=1 Tax=Intestinibacter sp. TaxID=1965304 RepID=UPI002A7F52F7|nr:hypothetical protein [Intestinibacter sp.]MDY4574799.1 hypothetical protein [Intestinibacter sp.]
MEKQDNQNNLGDLNNYLFNTLKRLDDKNLKGDELKDEILRAKSITDVAAKIVDNANLVLNAEKFKAETLGRSTVQTSKLLEG